MASLPAPEVAWNGRRGRDTGATRAAPVVDAGEPIAAAPAATAVVAAGGDTVPELVQRNPVNLFHKLSEVNAEKN